MGARASARLSPVGSDHRATWIPPPRWGLGADVLVVPLSLIAAASRGRRDAPRD